MQHDFTIPDDPAEFAVWIAQQTEAVQTAAKLFPLGLPVQLNERLAWVVGYTPEGEVVTIVSDPATLTFEQLQAEVKSCVLLDPNQLVQHTQRH